MTLRERFYDAAVHAARPLLGVAGAISPKAGRAAAGRRTAASSLEAWSRSGRWEDRPLVWLHGASVGELAGAAPVLRRMRRERELQLAVTYSSPSAERAVRDLAPDVVEFAPLDTRRDTGRALRALRPSCLVYAKGDVWPGLTASAKGAGTAVALVNATVQEGSSRLRSAARYLLSPAYRRLDAVGAATDEDAERLERLGVDPDRVRVTGDAALDEALARVESSAGSEARERLERWRPEGAPLLLAGSTWPADEEVLLRAAASLRGADRDVSLVLAPHEPSDGAVERLTGRVRELLGVDPGRWTDGGSAADVLVVDVVGVLAELYPAADLAYVGGGFGKDGLHSVVEPAAAGVPVAFGPRHRRWEAERLLGRGAAVEVRRETAEDVLGEILASPERRAAMGRSARAFVQEGAGAAEAGAEMVAELLEDGRPGS